MFFKLQKLCIEMDELWSNNKNSPILFTWISFLQYELFSYLNLNTNEIEIGYVDNDLIDKLLLYEFSYVDNKHIEDKRVSKQVISIDLLKDYDQDQDNIKFLSQVKFGFYSTYSSSYSSESIFQRTILKKLIFVTKVAIQKLVCDRHSIGMRGEGEGNQMEGEMAGPVKVSKATRQY